MLKSLFQNRLVTIAVMVQKKNACLFNLEESKCFAPYPAHTNGNMKFILEYHMKGHSITNDIDTIMQRVFDFITFDTAAIMHKETYNAQRYQYAETI